MILYPAIDIRGGLTVRLAQGDYDRETAFDQDPVDAAGRFAEAGARFLHVVDLDGAREGRPRNLEWVRRITATVDVPVQVGGGLRDERSVETALDAGASRVVLGTAAQADPTLVERLTRKHPERIAVSVDTRGGRVSVWGWTEPTDTPAAELVRELGSRGVRRFIYTPVEVDGMLAGPGTEQLRELAAEVEGELIYSGGIAALGDLCELAALGLPNLAGVIVGRALYEERFTVSEGQRALDER